MSPDIRDPIARAPLFRDLSERDVSELASIARKVRYERDQMIFWQDSPAEGFYVVVSGRIKVFKLSFEGREQILHLFGPGEPIGEVPVFSGGTFPANAQALEDSDLVFFPRDKLRELFAHNPSLAMNMLAVLAQRLREFTQLIEDLSLKELPSRLAAYLLHQRQATGTDEDVVTLDVSKGILSKILGTSQETLSRVLRRMSEAGLIDVNRRDIRILDRTALEDLAEGLHSLDR
jgi:CRP/FNR family transcriptional regulator